MDHQISNINISQRKYNTEYRKKFLSKFNKIVNKNDLILIYNIIVEDIGNNYSFNRNGIFINMNIISDKCIHNLIEFVDNKKNISLTYSENEKLNYKTYKFDDVDMISEMGHKLSTQEKNIIKRIRNNKISI
jgi:hypothetical protein